MVRLLRTANTRLFVLVPVLTACGGVQSALAPAGPAAERIATVWWAMFWGAAIILALVMLLALIAYRAPPGGAGRPGRRLIVGGGVIFPTVVLTVLLIYGVQIDYPLLADGSDPLEVEVTGHQWWWEVRYPGEGREAVTANELHIPVGRTVRIRLRSGDVIHSFWVPRLAGKQDAIPGHDNVLELRADLPGAYRGQCAEFCGAQHARMAFWVVAESPERFSAWLEQQREAAPPPVTASARRGRERFLQLGCADCHTIRGTPAQGDKAPDLTHVAGRRTIAAGTLATTRPNLARWIGANQRIKPGNRMEDFSHLDASTLKDLANYLYGLK